MGHFTIHLPNNSVGDVRWGTVRKKELMSLLNLFRKYKLNTEERIGYIIKVEQSIENRNVYRFLKSKEGQWLQKEEAGFQVREDDEISLAIKKAIDEYENQHRSRMI